MDFLKLISEGRVEQFETKYGKKSILMISFFKKVF